jgi:Family of unknown function (DUF6152)
MTTRFDFALPLIAGAMLSLTASSSQAHHSVAAGFDMAKTATVEGTIKRMEWTNPHARLFIEVKDAHGGVESWTAWFSSANGLIRRGWRSDHLPVGATVIVSGFPARDGSHQVYGGKTTLPDGRVLFGGNAPGEK